MAEKAVVHRMTLPPGRRILAVSDIHANPLFLEKLLEQAAFGPEDLLFLLGDMVEKGYESLKTLRYIMGLMAQNDNVYGVLGNCDSVTLEFLDWDDADGPGYFPWYLNQWRGRSLLTEVAAGAGLPLETPADYPPVRALLRQAYAPEIAFLRSLPTIIDTEEMVFVHGGVPDTRDMEQLGARRCMKNDSFLTQETHLEKWCVVGHWPVRLYRPHIPSAEPIIAWEKHIVSIDGGCSLNRDGQLNLLILPHGGSEDFSWQSYDGLPTAVALEGQTGSAQSVNVRWGLDEIQVLERGEEFSRCLHLRTGRTLLVLTDQIYQRGGALRCDDTTDYRLPLAPGDVFSVVRETSRGVLAKRNGITGWYTGRYEMGDQAPQQKRR